MIRFSFSRASRHPHASTPFFAVALMLLLALTLAACDGLRFGNSSGPGITVTVQIAHGQDDATLVLLPLTISGKGPFTFALDTGASTSLVDTSLARQLRLPRDGAPQPINGVSGTEQAIPVRVSTWNIEQIKLPQMTIESAQLFTQQRGASIRGLIGSDIWSRFGTVTINYSDGTLTVPKQIADIRQPAPHNAGIGLDMIALAPSRVTILAAA